MQNNTWDKLLVDDHEMIERAMDVLKKELMKMPDKPHDSFVIRRAVDFLLEFGDRIHNRKEETVLFPLMVKHGIPEDGPIRVMLMEHESERNLLATMMTDISGLEKATVEEKEMFKQKGIEYLEIRANHIWKENDILFNMGRQVFQEKENQYLMEEFDRISTSAYGESAYQKFTQMLEEVEKGSKVRQSLIHNLSMEQIDAIMETMPVEITFVDADDTVAYFNRLDKDKIFVRTRSVIGRKIEMCHPQKSVDKVRRIVEGFKDGTRDKAEFWIDFMGDKILIGYFPVRNEEGDYLGVLEVTQRIGEIQKIKGEKRLLD
jgi:DUF438 domain-containing protein